MSMRQNLRALQRAGACLPWRVGAAAGLYRGGGAPVQFVVENAAWAIRWVGEHVRDEIEKSHPGMVEVTVAPQRLANRVAHFGSQYMWLAWGRHMASGNRYVTSFFHGKREDGPEVSAHIDAFLESAPRLSKVVTAASIMETRLIGWGVPREKIARIPIGVDTGAFRPPTPEERAAARTRFGLADDRLVVGSFQKDGQGWGEGMEPKRIKGPDIFLDAVAGLAKHRPVTAFLTGPARGYVKAGLERLGVPFVHTYVEEQTDLAACYHALDLYLVTSREEGGPMGLMEGMASAVPVVSTPVGMAPDLITDGVTGGLADAEDAEGVTRRALELLATEEAAARLKAAAREAVMVADWSVVGREHWSKVYKPLLEG